MTRNTPLWEQAGSYGAALDRRLIGTLWPNPAVYGCAVSVPGGSMNMNITPGAVVAPTVNSTGSVLCYSDAIEVVTSPTAPGAGLNRYDLVVCQPRGNDLDGGTNNDFIFQVISGTAAASPAIPAVPAGAVALAQILVVGGSASLSAGNLSDRRPTQVDLTKLPQGRLVGGYAERTTTAGPQGPEATIAVSITVIVPANRNIRLEAMVRGVNLSVSTATGLVRIREGTLTGTLIASCQYPPNAGGGGPGGTFGQTIQPGAGQHTYLLTIEGVGGNATIVASTTERTWLEAIDIGGV